jgi:hypothetical protein
MWWWIKERSVSKSCVGSHAFHISGGLVGVRSYKTKSLRRLLVTSATSREANTTSEGKHFEVSVSNKSKVVEGHRSPQKSRRYSLYP